MERIRFTIIIGVLATVFALLSMSAHAEILNVPDDFETIQEAIDETEDGDTVLVQPGRYVENIDFDGHNIVIGSLFVTTGDTAFVERTIIDGDEEDSVVQIGSGEGEEAVLSGFTIRNGYAVLGGGIFIRNSSPTLTRLIVHDNTAAYPPGGVPIGGGGIYMDRNANPAITNVTIRENWARMMGGGLHIEDQSNPTLRNCNISDNIGEGWGGGIAIRENSNPVFDLVVIIGNRSNYDGGGIFCDGASHPTLNNTTIAENRTLRGYHGGGIFCGDGSTVEMNFVSVRDNTSSAKGGGIYCVWDSNIIANHSKITGNSTMGGIGDGGGIFIDLFGSIIMNHVLIADNSASGSGGGIGIGHQRTGPELFFTNVTFACNTAEVDGGGIFLYNGTYAEVINGIFRDNTPQQIFAPRVRDLNTLTISYSDIEGGEDGIEDNHNIDIDWLEGNIDADPLFVSPDEGDYHLTEDSPCIDTGDPDREPDPDHTRADMGAFYFPQVNPDPDIHVQPDSIVFPLTAVDASEEVVLTIRNFGGDTLDVSSQAIVEEEDPFFISEGWGDFQLEPQATHETTILFEPLGEGDFEAVFRIECNDPDEEIVEIPITGSAVLMVPDIDVDADSLYYGNLGINVTAEIVVTISSIGNAPVEILYQYIYPDDEYFYIRDGGGEVLLEPDSTHETVVAFAPREYGDFEALYIIESNDPDEGTIEIPLIGYALDVASLEKGLPTEFAITEIYPNPFNSTTTIRYRLPNPCNVSLKIYNLSGQRITTLFEGYKHPGIHTTTLTANDLPSGLYFIRLDAGVEVMTQKVMLIK